MSIFKRAQKPKFEGGGLVLFQEVQEAMKGEKVLKNADYNVRLVAPPPELRKGCDLAVEINLVEQPGIERVLGEKDVGYLAISPLNADTSEIIEIVKVTDFGKWLMVKAGNMKITFDKETEEIVNTSGGGCPDIPVMHIELLGKTLTEAPRPKDVGFTLCALMLDKALEESLILREGERV
ncbi:MAG: DUF3343 domain-containing protein [Dehalococcoidales bacterium]|nr:DUF3343 domain-containing protein [Dehalococcoidales bacterium]